MRAAAVEIVVSLVSLAPQGTAYGPERDRVGPLPRMITPRGPPGHMGASPGNRVRAAWPARCAAELVVVGLFATACGLESDFAMLLGTLDAPHSPPRHVSMF